MHTLHEMTTRLNALQMTMALLSAGALIALVIIIAKQAYISLRGKSATLFISLAIGIPAAMILLYNLYITF